MNLLLIFSREFVIANIENSFLHLSLYLTLLKQGLTESHRVPICIFELQDASKMIIVFKYCYDPKSDVVLFHSDQS